MARLLRVKRDGQQFLVFVGVCVLQGTLANESIVLYMCEGKALMDKSLLVRYYRSQ